MDRESGAEGYKEETVGSMQYAVGSLKNNKTYGS